MYATDFFESKVLNTFRGVDFAGIRNVYVGLFINSPTETGVGGVEVEYEGYTRPKIDFSIPYPESGGIGIKNTNEILWAESPIDVGEARYIGVYDSATKGTGNMLLYGELSIPLEIKTNQQPSIYGGDLLYYSIGDFSVSFKTKMLNVLRGETLEGFMPHLCLFDGDPENAGVELSGGAYARVPINFANPVKQVGGQTQIQNAERLLFPSPTSTWGLWGYDGIKDNATGGELVLKSINVKAETIYKNYVPSCDAGDYKISVN